MINGFTTSSDSAGYHQLVARAPIYARYAGRGGAPDAPELLFGLLVYGYPTRTFSSPKIERATYESAPFRFLAGNRHPDHDTLATFRKTWLPELHALFVQVLLLAQAMGVLQLGTISIDGTKIHADASKRKAVSYKRLRELEVHLCAEVEALFVLGAQADQDSLPDGLTSAMKARCGRHAWPVWRRPKRMAHHREQSHGPND